jgi:hypothetical protein
MNRSITAIFVVIALLVGAATGGNGGLAYAASIAGGMENTAVRDGRLEARLSA